MTSPWARSSCRRGEGAEGVGEGGLYPSFTDSFPRESGMRTRGGRQGRGGRALRMLRACSGMWWHGSTCTAIAYDSGDGSIGPWAGGVDNRTRAVKGSSASCEGQPLNLCNARACAVRAGRSGLNIYSLDTNECSESRSLNL
jgi:hypothetical protein